MSETFKETWARLTKKGGSMHMSLKGGVVANIKGERPMVIVPPCGPLFTSKKDKPDG